MRTVIDTNVIASAMFFGGKPRLLLEIAMSGKLEVYASEEIVVEYKETVEELQARYPGKPLHLPLAIMIAAMKLIAPVSHVHVCRDPDDDKFIDCALDGKCMYIVSGDKDLLSIGHYQGIEIVTVAEFLKQYELKA